MGAQQSTTGSPFGKPAFGATTSTTGFGFGSTAPQNANPFGASTANKPFGTGLQTQTQPVLFGGNTSQPSTGFGTGLFSNTQVSGCFDGVTVMYFLLTLLSVHLCLFLEHWKQFVQQTGTANHWIWSCRTNFWVRF